MRCIIEIQGMSYLQVFVVELSARNKDNVFILSA